MEELKWKINFNLCISICADQCELHLLEVQGIFLAFADDLSLHFIILIMNSKIGASKALKNFKALVENQTWEKFKTYRSYGGREYNSLEPFTPFVRSLVL